MKKMKKIKVLDKEQMKEIEKFSYLIENKIVNNKKDDFVVGSLTDCDGKSKKYFCFYCDRKIFFRYLVVKKYIVICPYCLIKYNSESLDLLRENIIIQNIHDYEVRYLDKKC